MLGPEEQCWGERELLPWKKSILRARVAGVEF